MNYEIFRLGPTLTKKEKLNAKNHNYFVTIIMPVAGSNLFLEKVSDSPNFSQNFFSRIPFYCVHSFTSKTMLN